MMTSSNGNIFRVTGHLCGEFTGDRSPVNSPHKGQWCGALMFSLICVWINGWVNNREAGDLRRYRAHYDVTVMSFDTMVIRGATCYCSSIPVCEQCLHKESMWWMWCEWGHQVRVNKYSRTVTESDCVADCLSFRLPPGIHNFKTDYDH